MPDCFIPGCKNTSNDGRFGIRCRDHETNAIWSPDTGAYLCDMHVAQGLTVDIIITPNNSQRIEMTTRSGDNVVKKNHLITKTLKKDSKKGTDKGSLFSSSDASD
jgi:hypothetical protein